MKEMTTRVIFTCLLACEALEAHDCTVPHISHSLSLSLWSVKCSEKNNNNNPMDNTRHGICLILLGVQEKGAWPRSPQTEELTKQKPARLHFHHDKQAQRDEQNMKNKVDVVTVVAPVCVCVCVLSLPSLYCMSLEEKVQSPTRAAQHDGVVCDDVTLYRRG